MNASVFINIKLQGLRSSLGRNIMLFLFGIPSFVCACFKRLLRDLILPSQFDPGCWHAPSRTHAFDEKPSSAQFLTRVILQASEEKQTKVLQEQLAGINSKLEEATRTLGDFESQKKKLAMENSDLLHEASASSAIFCRADAKCDS